MIDEEKTRPESGNTDSPWSTLATVVAVLGCVFAAVLGISYFSQSQNLAPPPEVDFSGVPAEVVGVITRSRELVRASPDSGEAWGQLAMVLRAHDFGPESDACFERAEELDPRNARWPYLLGVSWAVYDIQGAKACYRRAIAIDPEAPDLRFARLRLAELLLGEARLDQAEQQFQAALRLTPVSAIEDQARAMLGLAQAAWAREDVKGSRLWAEKSVARASQQRSTRELLSKIYYRLGEREAALREVKVLDGLPAGKTSWPDPWVAAVLEMRWDPDYRIKKAQQQFSIGKQNGDQQQVIAAILQARDLVQKHPERPSYHGELARMWLITEQLPQAAAALDRAIRLHPMTAELHRLRGLVHYTQHELTQAEGSFREAIKLKAEDAETYEDLGRCLQMAEDIEGAVQAFHNAVRFNPNSPGAHMNLGEIFYGQGRYDEAIKHLELGIAVGPDDQKAEKLLEQAKLAKAQASAAQAQTEQ